MATSRLEINLSAIDRNYGILRQALDTPRPPAAPAPVSAPVSGSAAAPAAAAPSALAAAEAGPAAGPVSGPKPARVAICGVIKQGAYGLGGPRMARKLSALGAEMLAVYCLDEARELAEAPIQTPILVLMPVRTIDRADPVYRLAVRSRLHLVVHDPEQALELASVASRVGLRLPVHVQLDTGLSRGGSLEPEATRIVETVLASPRLQLAGLMTHFSSPSTDDVYTREQAKLFRTWIESIKARLAGSSGVMIHAANTAAALRSKSLHAGMVRIGQGLYGFGFESFTDPLAVEHASFGKQLKPAVRWLSKIVHIHEVPKGSAIGYGRTFKTQRPTRVALVPVGYADGYPIALSSHAQNNTPVARVGLTGLIYDRPRGGEHVEVFERPSVAPVVGRVSMDQITIDVTGLPETLARVGAEVELIGADPQGPNHLPTLAKAAGTITHELLCRVCPSIERVYVSPGTRAAGEPGPGPGGGAGGAGGGLGHEPGGRKGALEASVG